MKNLVATLVFILLALITLPLGGCSGTNRLGKAKKNYDLGEYHRATSSLNSIYRKEKNKYYKGEISYFLGHSYRKVNQPRRAASAFSRAIRHEYPEPEAILYQAEELRKMGSYEEAIELYNQYMKDYFGDQRAYNGKASCNLALKPPPPTAHVIEQIRKLNSRNSDFSPFIAPDDPSQLYFTSLRQEKKNRRRESKITGQGLASIYTVIHNSRGEWQDPELMLPEESSTEWEDGVISITADGKEAYFTRTRYDDSGPMGAEIWTTKKMGGRWGAATEVELGPDSLVYAHPAISPNGKTLYFVSDMPGGYGGKDIWKSTSTGEGWGVPVNLGIQINTAGDEMFPYVRENGYLYFSSDGQIGYGGLDIFEAQPKEEDEWIVRNMGQPINSMSDDFGITFHQNREAGFFSSSRDNSRGTDNIYSFAVPVIQLVLVGNITIPNNQPIPEKTLVRIIGTDGTNIQINVQPSGDFSTLLKPENDYILQVSSSGYYNQSKKLSTKGVNQNKEFEINISLEPFSSEPDKEQ